MRTTPLPLVAALVAGCVGGTDTKESSDTGDTTTEIPPMPYYRETADTGDTHIAPMPPPHSGDTGYIPPMEPPTSGDTGYGGTGYVAPMPPPPITGGTGAAPAPLRGLSPLPDLAETERLPR